MADDPRRYEAEVVRVRRGSGMRPIVVWVGGAALVAAVGLAGTLFTPRGSEAPTAHVATTAPPVVALGTAVPTGHGPVEAAMPPLDITSGASGYAAAFEAHRRRSIPLIIESTDFHANSGSAYYGIGGKLLRALETKPPSTTP